MEVASSCYQEFTQNVVVCAYQVYRALHDSTCEMCFGMEMNACTAASKPQWLPTVEQALRNVMPEMIAAVYASSGVDLVGKDSISALDGHRDEMVEAIATETINESAKTLCTNHYNSQQYIVPALQQSL